MDSTVKALLKELVVKGRDLFKESSAIIEGEFGSDVQKAAKETAQVLLDSGWTDGKDKDILINTLIFDKRASLLGLKRISESSSLIPVGTPDRGKTTKSGSFEDSEELWNRQWGF